MAYTINKTDGTVVATITDGTVDTSTSLQLFGKSFSGFGEGLNENLVKLLENSASTSAPTAPLKGELWFDTSANSIKVYDGTSFKPTGGARSQSAEPTSASAGDLWHDSDDDQVYFYTGSAWQLLGPVFTSGQTLSGWVVETVTASSISKVIASMYAGNIRVAVLSKEAFTPDAGSPSGTPLAANGFATIAAGITLNSTLGASFSGNSTQATAVDVSGTTNTSASVIAGGNFLRADAADTTTGALTIDADAGLIVGDEQELTITASSGDVTVAQTRQDKNLSFTINDGGVTKTPLSFAGTTGNITLTGNTTITGNLSITGEFENTSSGIITVDDAFIKVNTGNSEVDAGIIVETSDTDDARLFYDVSEDFWSAGHNQSYSQIVRVADLTDDGDANKGTKGLTTDSSTGDLKVTSLTLGAVGSNIATSDTSNAKAPSIGQVAESIKRWGGSVISDDSSNSVAGNRYVETSAPTSGQGSNGDLWFVREA
tara:strand:- start:7619 stop:9079 length:1461 start_codon:yes stop_codon:yes gene_type:complete